MRYHSIVAVSIFVWPMGAIADAPSQWYNDISITYLYAGDVGARVSVKTNAAVNLGSCSPAGEFVVDETSPRAERIFSVLLASHIAGKQVSLFTNGTCMHTGVKLSDVKIAY